MILIFFLLLHLFFCQTIKELRKYDSINVIPNTKIYLDLSNFNDNEEVCFEITMDLYYDIVLDRREYTFYLEQVSFKTHPSSSYWDTLPPVIAKYKEEYFDEVTFKYDVIKQPGSTYIYLRTPAPFRDYYNIWDNRIKIENVGGSGVNTLAIVLVIVFVIIIIIIIIIIYCVYTRRKRYYVNGTQRVIPQPVYIQTNPAQPIYPQQGYIYQNVPQQNYLQPNVPQNNYQYINVQRRNQQQNYPRQNHQQPNIPDTAYNSHLIQQPNVPDSNYTSTPQKPISVNPHPFDTQIDSKSDFIGKDNAAPNLYNQ